MGKEDGREKGGPPRESQTLLIVQPPNPQLDLYVSIGTVERLQIAPTTSVPFSPFRFVLKIERERERDERIMQGRRRLLCETDDGDEVVVGLEWNMIMLMCSFFS